MEVSLAATTLEEQSLIYTFPETFKMMLPFVSQHNLRFVRLNLRDYPGSSPWSQDELDGIREGRETARDTVASMGVEIAAFLAWYIETQNIPALSSSEGIDEQGARAKGGISVGAWSMGNIASLSFLANLDKVPEATVALLGKYLRSYVMFGK